MKHQVTIKDIANKLGVSTSTVSRALKDHPDISEKTREAVQELAKILVDNNYKVGITGRREANLLDLKKTNPENYFISSTTRDISNKSGRFYFICTTSSELFTHHVN